MIPFTQCSLGMEEQTYSETKLAPKLFVEQTCVQGQRTVPHIKQVGGHVVTTRKSQGKIVREHFPPLFKE